MHESTITTPLPAGTEALERREAEYLGRALQVLRIRAGLTRAEAAKRIGLATEQGWAKYERGIALNVFRPSVRERLARALGVGPAALVDEIDRVRAAAEAAP